MSPAEIIKSIIDGLGVSVLLPIIIFFIAKCFRVTWSRAIRSAVLIGIGFIGINAVLGIFLGEMGSVAGRMVDVTGTTLPALDVGWPAAAAIAWGIGTVGVWMIPAFLLLNLAMLGLKLTNTLNIDVWNYWHFAFTGALILALTGNIVYAFIGGLLMGAICLVCADWTASAIEETFDLPGVSIPHGFSVPFALIVIPINWLLDKTPIKNIHADPEAVKKKLGFLGEPIMLGLIIGFIIALVAYSNALGEASSWYTILKTAMCMAAVMHILPMMVGILMEGLVPLSEAIRNTMTSRYKNRAFNIGLDSAILIGHPSAIASSLILIPICIGLMIILPGNAMLLAVDLAVLPFLFCMMVPIMRGNIVKMVIAGTIIMIPTFYIGTALYPAFTNAAKEAGFGIPAGTMSITSICDGANPLTYLLSWAVPWGFVIGGILFVVILVALKKWPKKMAVIGGASEDFVNKK